MSTGADLAMNSAQVTLVKVDLLLGIVRARLLSQASNCNVRQNPYVRLYVQRTGVELH